MIYRVIITCEVDADTPQIAAAVTTVRAYDLEIVPKALRVAPVPRWSDEESQLRYESPPVSP